MKMLSKVLNREFEFETHYCGIDNNKKWPHYKWHCVINGQENEGIKSCTYQETKEQKRRMFAFLTVLLQLVVFGICFPSNPTRTII